MLFLVINDNIILGKKRSRNIIGTFLSLRGSVNKLKYQPIPFICWFRSINCQLMTILVVLFYQLYQFWTRADENGYFFIRNVLTGDYNLYAWVPGFIGDYRCDANITITSGFILRTLVISS